MAEPDSTAADKPSSRPIKEELVELHSILLVLDDHDAILREAVAADPNYIVPIPQWSSIAEVIDDARMYIARLSKPAYFAQPSTVRSQIKTAREKLNRRIKVLEIRDAREPYRDDIVSRVAALEQDMRHIKTMLETGIPTIETAGQKIKRLRLACEWTGDELSGKTGISERTISRHENGTVNPSLDSIKSYNTAFSKRLKGKSYSDQDVLRMS